MSRHARRTRGRHLKRPAPYQGWAPIEDRTPPMGFPVIQAPPMNSPMIQAPTPRQPMSAPLRWAVAGLCAMAGGLVMLIAVLGLALAMDPGPAQAENVSRETPRIEQMTEIPDQRVRVTVTSQRIKVVSRTLCPDEDSCEINYVGDGTWVIERTAP